MVSIIKLIKLQIEIIIKKQEFKRYLYKSALRTNIIKLIYNDIDAIRYQLRYKEHFIINFEREIQETKRRIKFLEIEIKALRKRDKRKYENENNK